MVYSSLNLPLYPHIQPYVSSAAKSATAFSLPLSAFTQHAAITRDIPTKHSSLFQLYNLPVCQGASNHLTVCISCGAATQQHLALLQLQLNNIHHYVLSLHLLASLTATWITLRWLTEASVPALQDAKEAIEREIASREAQEKEAFLQFWKDHPVPCNRFCRQW